MKDTTTDIYIIRINEALRVAAMRQRAEMFRRSPEWKAVVKELKARKMNTKRTREAVFTAMMNR